jgi:hypothetical protein
VAKPVTKAAEVNEATAAQIPAQNPSDKSDIMIKDSSGERQFRQRTRIHHSYQCQKRVIRSSPGTALASGR